MKDFLEALLTVAGVGLFIGLLEYWWADEETRKNWWK